MVALGGFNVFMSGIVPALINYLSSWTPEQYNSEAKYQKSLFDFLSNLSDCIIRMNYPEAGALNDIYLKRESFFGYEEVFFELKYNLKGKPEFNRLVGQLLDLNPKKRKIIVVLCGKTDSSIPLRLKEHFKEFINDDLNPFLVGTFEPQMSILTK